MSEILAANSGFVRAWTQFPVNPDKTNSGRYYPIGIDDVQNVHPALVIDSSNPWELFALPTDAPGVCGHAQLDKVVAGKLGYKDKKAFFASKNPVSGYVMEDINSELHLEIDLTDRFGNQALSKPKLCRLGREMMEATEISSIVAVIGQVANSDLLKFYRITRDDTYYDRLPVEETYRYEGVVNAFGLNQPGA